MREYDVIAEWYARERGDLIGVPEALSLAASLPAGSRILDAGCGNGRPLTQVLSQAGHQVVGVDSSAAMLTRCRAALPSTPVVRGRLQECPFRDASFDAAMMWGVLFHLTPEEQDVALRELSRVLRAGGQLLFTAGDEDSGLNSRNSVMNGVEFYHYPYSRDGYARVLASHGLALRNCVVGAGQNIYYHARKHA